MTANFQARLAEVKLLALDVDGVLTDGGLYYTETGEEQKKFNIKDGLGIRRAMAAGIEVVFISANRSQATVYRAKKLGIVHALVGIEDKLPALQQICEQLGISLSQVAYMGDDLIDIPILQTVGCPITVADAVAEVIAIALYTTQKGGGQGAVREVCDLLVRIHSD